MATTCYQNVSYENVKLSVMNNLWADILLSHDFRGLHEKMEAPLSDEFGTILLCSLDAAKVQSSPLVHSPPDCKPIVA